MTERIKQAISEFENMLGNQVCEVATITNSASNRTYLRFRSNGQSYIGTIGEQIEENRAFIQLSNHLNARGIRVPRVLFVSQDNLYYIQEDLGDLSLFDLMKSSIAAGDFSETHIVWIERTLQHLLEFQYKGIEELDRTICYPRESFDLRAITWDLNYFKYCFLKPALSTFLEDRLEDEFELLANHLLSIPANVLVHRDFQSRNVMISDNTPWFIDFQGARLGTIYYDLASFVFQTRLALPETVRDRVIESYRHGLSNYEAIEKQYFYDSLNIFALFRTIQLLGAYGYRGLIEGKKDFLVTIDTTIDQLHRFLLLFSTDYPYLLSLIPLLKQRFAAKPLKVERDISQLTVEVFSFSYKKGVPSDSSGNGGGYVFDCRALHNPGRYAEYKQLTGRDEPVIRFLEGGEEVLQFLQSVFALADSSVDRYIERGFTHLQFAFGCTGGQHRSVYCAERLSKHIYDRFKVKTRLIHREQGIELIYGE